MKREWIILIGVACILVVIALLAVILITGNNDDLPEPSPVPTLTPEPTLRPTPTPEITSPPTPEPTPDPDPAPEWPPQFELDPARFDITLDEWIEQNRVIPEVLPEPEDIYELSAHALMVLRRFDFIPSYRYVYYSIAPFGGMQDIFNVSEWSQQRSERIPVEYRDERLNIYEFQNMELLDFIKFFRIPRDVFDEAVEAERLWRIYIGNDVYDEQYEMPNGDIIYTFDNDIINEFYRRRG